MGQSPPTGPATEPPTTQPLPPIGSIENPASSCTDIPQDQPSGYYYIGNASSSVQIYCDMNRTSCGCSAPTGWARVAYLDMTNENETCPEGFSFREYDGVPSPLRTCGRPEAVNDCASTTYQAYGISYSKVCGRIRGYQDFSTDGFFPYHNDNSLTIDSPYLEGISLTYGEPRQHLWSFAAGHSEGTSGSYVCPCTNAGTFQGTVPPFVGENYFCETATPPNVPHPPPEEPLWDGQDCGDTSDCCEFNNPPWFCKQLDNPTIDDIELRICSSRSSSFEDIPFDQVEIYVR